jgi:anti-sigma regulatory factor (Ser/Thr protein kinase)
MSDTVPQSVTIPAVPGQVRAARAFVAGVLGASHPHADAALLLASELVTNSVRHSGSAVPGGLVTVTVAAGGGGVRVEVTDRGGDSAPVLLPAAFAGGGAEGSRGCGSRTHSPRGGVTSGTAGSRRHDSSLRRTEPGWLDLACTFPVPRMYLPSARRSPAGGNVRGRRVTVGCGSAKPGPGRRAAH